MLRTDDGTPTDKPCKSYTIHTMQFMRSQYLVLNSITLCRGGIKFSWLLQLLPQYATQRPLELLLFNQSTNHSLNGCISLIGHRILGLMEATSPGREPQQASLPTPAISFYLTAGRNAA